MTNIKNIQDIMICPKCNSDNCYRFDTDELEFEEDGSGHFIFFCHCKDCKNDFRVYTNFEYNITNVIY